MLSSAPDGSHRCAAHPGPPTSTEVRAGPLVPMVIDFPVLDPPKEKTKTWQCERKKSRTFHVAFQEDEKSFWWEFQTGNVLEVAIG